MALYLNALGIINPLGAGKENVAKSLFAGSLHGLRLSDRFIDDKDIYVGEVITDLPSIDPALSLHDSRNNRLALAALNEISADIDKAIADYGRERIAVVVGTSTSGIGDNEAGVAEKVKTGSFPPEYHYQRQTPSDLSSFIQAYLDLQGPAFTVSTACTSGAKAVVSAARLIEAGLCDCAIVGGSDSLCGLTLNGFHALESLSDGKCQPFSKNRDGINIGEGAAFFLLSKTAGPVMLSGYGETSDAYHISAPAPDGEGAYNAMKAAMGEHAVAYVNLHGTATELNDAMEAKAVSNLLGHDVPCSSTKSLTGHMLGAAGANELGFLWLSLVYGQLPPHVWDGVFDPALPKLNFVASGQSFDPHDDVVLSNSFAFGGNNICVALKKGMDI